MISTARFWFLSEKLGSKNRCACTEIWHSNECGTIFFSFLCKNFFWAHVLFCKCKESLRGTNNDVVVNASSALELLNEEPASHYKNNSANLEKKSYNLKFVVTLHLCVITNHYLLNFYTKQQQKVGSVRHKGVWKFWNKVKSQGAKKRITKLEQGILVLVLVSVKSSGLKISRRSEV